MTINAGDVYTAQQFSEKGIEHLSTLPSGLYVFGNPNESERLDCGASRTEEGVVYTVLRKWSRI